MSHVTYLTHMNECVAVCCSVLQWVTSQTSHISMSHVRRRELCHSEPPSSSSLHATSTDRAYTSHATYLTHMNECVAVCCSVLQCVAVCCSVLQWVTPRTSHIWMSVLQCVAVCCSESCHVPHTYEWVCCSVLQCVIVCCSVLQCVAVRCNESRHVPHTYEWVMSHRRESCHRKPPSSEFARYLYI